MPSCRAALLAVAFALSLSARDSAARERTDRSPGTDLRSAPAPGSPDLPLHFEANRGQTDPRVRFLARPRGYRVFLTDAETVFLLPRGGGGAPAADVLRMSFEGAAPAVPAGEEPLPGRSHYFLGKDPAKWVTGAPHFGAVASRGILPGIDVRWRGLEGNRLEYDLVVAPGADPGSVVLRFDGARSAEVDPSGDLLVRTAGGILRHGRPVAWQEVEGARRPVSARFAPVGGGRVGFATGPFDRGLPLVIDPVVGFSTYLGGSSTEEGTGIGAGSDGQVCVGGWTWSMNFPVASAYDSTHWDYSGGTTPYDAFVTKFSTDGSALVYSTFLGGSGSDRILALAMGSDGSAYIAGGTTSYDWPVKNPIKATRTSQNDTGFLTKLSPSGASLVYSTFHGGTGNDQVFGLAVAADGTVAMAGYTSSSDFPVKSAIKSTMSGFDDGFATVVNPAGSALVWSTYVGGSDQEYCKGVAFGPGGDVLVTGYTKSSNFPVVQAWQSTRKGTQDAFVARIAADGSAFSWSTYLGGSGFEYGNGIAAAADGGVWVVGTTLSSDFPLQSAVRSTFSGGQEGFLTKFAGDGASVSASTFLGGSSYEGATCVATDASGVVFVGGYTDSTDLAVVSATQAVSGGNDDGFLAAIAPAGDSVLWCTYLGGTYGEYVNAISASTVSRLLVTGKTDSTDFPTAGAYQGTSTGSAAFVFTLRGSPVPPLAIDAGLTGLTSVQATWSDSSQDETGFRVERKTGAGAFGILGTTAAGVTTWDDVGLDPETTYTYRVRAFNDYGISGPSGEAEVTTPPAPTSPPDAPSNLQAVVVTPRRVDLTWSDNSDDEDFFTLARASGPSLFATLATPTLGKTAYVDATVLPERTYSWKIRAQNPLGTSLFSGIATVTMPPTLDVAVTKGKIADGPDIRKDAVTLAGTFAYAADAEHAAFDPFEQAFALRLGAPEDPAILNIPAADAGWTLRRGKYAWRSPKGSTVKAKVTVDPALDAFTVKLTGLTLPVSTANPLRATLTLGTDAGHHQADWTAPTKSGILRFPVPE